MCARKLCFIIKFVHLAVSRLPGLKDQSWGVERTQARKEHHQDKEAGSTQCDKWQESKDTSYWSGPPCKCKLCLIPWPPLSDSGLTLSSQGDVFPEKCPAPLWWPEWGLQEQPSWSPLHQISYELWFTAENNSSVFTLKMQTDTTERKASQSLECTSLLYVDSMDVVVDSLYNSTL